MSEIDSAIKLDAMRRLVNALETVDVVPVVRCKDCKWFDGQELCNRNGVFISDTNWFCADGERRESDDRER